MTDIEKTPAIIQADDADLQEKAALSLGDEYTVETGLIQATSAQVGAEGQNINPNFNKGVPNGPWVAPGEGQKFGYVEGLPQVEADAAAEDLEKSRRIHINAYPVGPVGESKIVADALEQRVMAARANADEK